MSSNYNNNNLPQSYAQQQLALEKQKEREHKLALVRQLMKSQHDQHQQQQPNLNQPNPPPPPPPHQHIPQGFLNNNNSHHHHHHPPQHHHQFVQPPPPPPPHQMMQHHHHHHSFRNQHHQHHHHHHNQNRFPHHHHHHHHHHNKQNHQHQHQHQHQQNYQKQNQQQAPPPVINNNQNQKKNEDEAKVKKWQIHCREREYLCYRIEVVFRNHRQMFGYVDCDPPRDLVEELRIAKDLERGKKPEKSGNQTVVDPYTLDTSNNKTSGGGYYDDLDNMKETDIRIPGSVRRGVVMSSMKIYKELIENLPFSEGAFVVVHAGSGNTTNSQNNNSSKELSNNNATTGGGLDIGKIITIRRVGMPAEFLRLPPLFRAANHQEVITFASVRKVEAEAALKFLREAQERKSSSEMMMNNSSSNNNNNNTYFFGVDVETDDKMRNRHTQQQQAIDEISLLKSNLFTEKEKFEIRNCEFSLDKKHLSIYYKKKLPAPETHHDFYDCDQDPEDSFILSKKFGTDFVHWINVDDPNLLTEVNVEKNHSERKIGQSIFPVHKFFDWDLVFPKIEAEAEKRRKIREMEEGPGVSSAVSRRRQRKEQEEQEQLRIQQQQQKEKEEEEEREKERRQKEEEEKQQQQNNMNAMTKKKRVPILCRSLYPVGGSCITIPPPLLVREGKPVFRRAGANPLLYPPAFLVFYDE